MAINITLLTTVSKNNVENNYWSCLYAFNHLSLHCKTIRLLNTCIFISNGQLSTNLFSLPLTQYVHTKPNICCRVSVV